MRKIFVILALVTFSTRLWQSTGCLNFLPTKFDPQIVKIKVEEQVNVDRGIERVVSRFFHNKASTGFFEVAKSTIRFTEPIFLLDILGPLGLVLIFLATGSLVKKFRLLQGLNFLVILVSILFAAATNNAKISFYTMAIALYSFSIWGTGALKTSKLTNLVFLVLFFITLWYFAFSWQMSSVCNEIFFN